MANLTRINNNQITDAVAGNVYTGINANSKVQAHSITSNLLANNLVYGSDLTINGNLSVTGNVTAIDTNNVTIEDPLLLLASTQTGSPTVDIGFIGQRGTSNNVASVWNEGLQAFVTAFTDSGAGDNTTINVLSYTDFITGAISAASLSLSGNVVSNLNVTGNIAGNNIAAAGNISATGNIIAAPGSYFIGDGSSLTGIVTSVSNINNGTSYANISTANGPLEIAINGNSTATFYDTGLSVYGNVTTSTNLNASNLSLSGNVLSNLSVTGDIVSNSVTTTNGVSAGGNVTAANFSTSGSGGNITGANVISAVTLTASGAVYAGTEINATGNITGGNLISNGAITAVGYVAGGNFYSTGDLTMSNGGNISGANVITANTINATVTLSTSGNIDANNVNTTNNVSAGGNVIAANFSTTGPQGNITGANVISSITLTASGNVYAADTLNGANLSLSGNVISNLNVTNDVSANNVFATTAISAVGNVTGGNITTVGEISAIGNIAGGNISTPNVISASGNIVTNEAFVGNNISGSSLVIASTSGGLQFSVTGNINAGGSTITNVPDPVASSDVANKGYVDGIANGLQVKASSNTASTGNIVTMTGSTYVYYNGPADDGIGATITLDNTGVIVIDTVTLTAGMRVLIKNEPLIAPTDGTTPSAAYNGIYDVTTAGAVGTALVLTRSTDDDVPAQMYSAYTFVTSPVGAVNTSTGWASTNTPTSPGDPIIVGTTFYVFVQFSSAGSYAAGNALSLTGSTFNTLVDVTTIDINGSNQLYIPANATLTTPNIGDAYGGSLSVTGSITGDVITGNALSTLGNVYAGNVYATVDVSAGGNVTVGQSSGSHTLSVYGDITTTSAGSNAGDLNISGAVSAAGNITTQTSLNGANLSLSGNVDSTLNVTGTVNANQINATVDVSANGNVIANYVNVGTNVSATGAVTGQNLYAGTDVSAGGNVIANYVTAGTDVSATGNINGNNVNVSTNVSATGNVLGANFITTGPQGNITGANVVSAVTLTSTGNVYAGTFFVGDGYYISNINAANVSSTKISNGSSFANIATPDGNIDLAVNTVTVGAFYNNGLSLTGNLEAANVNGTTISATGNITANNFNGGSLWNMTLGSHLLTNGFTINGGSFDYSYLQVGYPAGGQGVAINSLGNANATISTGTGGTAVNTWEFGVNGNLTTPGSVLVTGAVSTTGNIIGGTAFIVNTTANSVSVGNLTQTTGATFAINATDSMLLPVGNTVQRPTGATGMLRWNTTLSEVEVYNGAAWTGIGSGSYTVIQNEQFDGDGTTVAFTLGSSQTTDSCIVTINGVVQAPTTAYSVSGVYPTCVLTFTEAPQVGDTIDVREITSTTTVTAISNTSGNSVVSVQETIGEVDITGNLVAQVNSTAPTLSSNKTMSFQLLSDTSLVILVRGSDGTTRSATITLS